MCSWKEKIGLDKDKLKSMVLVAIGGECGMAYRIFNKVFHKERWYLYDYKLRNPWHLNKGKKFVVLFRSGANGIFSDICFF